MACHSRGTKRQSMLISRHSAKIVLTYFLLLSSWVQSSRTPISTVPWVQITRYNYTKRNKQRSPCSSKTGIFLYMFPCCVSGCALFIFLLLFYSPSCSPSAVLHAHPLAAASGSQGLRSANSAGTGNTLTLCPILSSPSKGQSKRDLQLR